ncbi:MAG: double-strand break repair helicase AddA [Pelagibacterium sp. SCN 63-23]|nr:MAG: double-strand break repair helicase AddA [Pelagibacterium sp. SCN 63-23]
MSERGQLRIPHDTLSSQARASDPDYSIWVEANAGSGKTFVLTHRVLRLLLAGIRPQSILCLTYTKAAAAEMRKRVGARLAQWALADEAELYKEIKNLTGMEPSDALLGAARTLFARALETPGGLRILTIHAFCEAVLHRFPIEAGVPFDFAVIEEDRQAQMVLSARESVLAEGLRGGANSAAVEVLFGLMSDDAIGKAINSALAEGARLTPVLADIAGAKARLRRLVGHDGETASALESGIIVHTLLTPDVLKAVIMRLNGQKQNNRRCADLLARLDPDAPEADLLRAAFFTGEGKPRATLITKAERAAHPDLEALLEAEQQRLVALEARINAARLVERSEAVLDVVAAIAGRYEAEKRRHALLDFDDLVEKLGDLFADRALGPWVQYKLDAGIDHILVDESQDTNERQWRVVRALADEFFSGAGAVTRPRSIFAVGDQKQSIYSFQGAQPVLFGETGREIGRRAAQAEKNFKQVRLHTSFRTLGGILAAVDRVCAREDIRAALLSGETIGHEAARIQDGGTVTLWPPVQETRPERGDGHWPREVLESEQSANRQVAQRLAREIRSWITRGRMLAQRQRAVIADDVLILVQKRGALFQEIIRALRLEGLPTPGADRLAVTGHIAVLDLLALIDVLLNPADDLQLAALLRSPLFAVSEDELFALAHGRAEGQSLWSALFASSLPPAQEAAERLGRWRSRLDMERPFEFLAYVLYAEGGLRRFHARLGREVDEVLSELFELALGHEQSEQPSLQGFVADMRRRSVTIKRELAESGGGVRVMTVHGAKGLEAPIVILADATGKPNARQTGKPVYVLSQAPGPLLVHAAANAQHVEASAALKDNIDAVLAEEYWRRLYVGMTRAEDELYVTGTLSAAQKPETQLEGSWYQAVEMALAPDLAPLRNADGEVAALVYPAHAAPSFAERPMPVEASAAVTLMLAPVPAPARSELVRPSGAGGDDRQVLPLQSLAEQARDADAARREGLALHALLQHLGRVPRAEWRQVALLALQTLLPDSDERHAPLAQQAMSILSRSDLARLFGLDSRAEVPFRLSARRRDEKVLISGRIDRLVVDESGVLVVDYKSDIQVPAGPDAVKGSYLTQLGLYALVAGQLFPGRPVEAAILWTSLESLMILPPDLLQQARADFTLG